MLTLVFVGVYLIDLLVYSCIVFLGFVWVCDFVWVVSGDALFAVYGLCMC